MPENRLQAAAERRKHMFGLAFAVFARPHRLAVDGDMTRFSVILEIQSAEDIGQRSRVDDAKGFGQRRMTRRRSANEAELRLLTPAHTASEKKRRLHATPSAQQRYGDQAEDRPQLVILPLLAARVRNLPQNRLQLHRIRPPRIRKPYSNQNVPVSSTSSSHSANRPVTVTRQSPPEPAGRLASLSTE